MSEPLAIPEGGRMATLPGGAEYQSANPLMMLASQLEKGVDPAKLEKLMDLADRWKAQQAEAEFSAAMNEAQASMPCIVKDAVNTHTNTRYARLETVNTQVKPVYSRLGFSLSFAQEDSKIDGCVRVICDVRHIGGHSKRYHLDAPLDGAGAKGTSNKTGIQALGSTLSYARRYLTLLIFNITVANEDIDGAFAESLEALTSEDVLLIEDAAKENGINVKRLIDLAVQAKLMLPGDPAIARIKAGGFGRVMEWIKRVGESKSKGGAK